MTIFFPMTFNLITPGHIQCLDILNRKGKIIVGLLTKKALQGYKKEYTPWKDRKYILEHLKIKVKVVAQDSLDPTLCIKKYKCDTIASGDGFEIEEKKAIKKLDLKIINIKLPRESKKRYSSSRIIKNIECKQPH